MTISLANNGCLLYKMALVMITILPRIRSRGHWSEKYRKRNK